jgi:hypothetical protein
MDSPPASGLTLKPLQSLPLSAIITFSCSDYPLPSFVGGDPPAEAIFGLVLQYFVEPVVVQVSQAKVIYDAHRVPEGRKSSAHESDCPPDRQWLDLEPSKTFMFVPEPPLSTHSHTPTMSDKQ